MKRLLLIILTALIIAAGLTFFLMRRTSPTETPTTNEGLSNQAGQTNTPVNTAPREKTAAEKEHDEAVALALLFTERFGSYSTETIDTVAGELAGFVTPAGATQTREVLRQQKSKYGTTATGVTTKALTTSFSQFKAGASATVDVQTQRSEQPVGGKVVDATSTLRLDLVKQGQQWKVNRAVWQ